MLIYQSKIWRHGIGNIKNFYRDGSLLTIGWEKDEKRRNIKDKVGIWTGMGFGVWETFESFWRVWPQKNEVDLTLYRIETFWGCDDWSDMAVKLKVSNSIVKLGARSLEKCFNQGPRLFKAIVIQPFWWTSMSWFYSVFLAWVLWFYSGGFFDGLGCHHFISIESEHLGKTLNSEGEYIIYIISIFFFYWMTPFGKLSVIKSGGTGARFLWSCESGIPDWWDWWNSLMSRTSDKN